ncbi:GntR family transcriptional regulator [Bacillus mesophilus]|uniref:GntR family transcriptional regulator n=1 Tax=Bacillus mesophilus TaxID=1808955 RepID=A0A6M0Q1X2_9BACI|nr:GntR family transcriptional regulator [Bacillus mesophilus]MBM7659300.1 GntR family transcriptional regulator [Bacillus mesophilus]NEY70174.1 GntR family transcriptional regulator [Bacillus mesophilus]
MTIKSDNRHLYLQVIDRLKSDIENGVYKEREKLPSEFDLAKHLGVSRATLREALRILEEENVVVRRHGVGTFVNPRPLFTSGIEQLNSVTNMIKQAGKVPGTIFLSSHEQGPTEEDIRRFNCSIEDEILVVERVRTADGDPVVYCIDKIPTKYFQTGYSHSEESVFRVLEKSGIFISHAVTHIEPLGYHEKISPILNCEPETALLLLKQMHFDQDEQPVLFSLNFFRADQFSFHVIRKRI